jgi:ribosome biogenesis GTPase
MAKKKIRVDLRKNRSKPPRDHQWTRGFQEHGYVEKATTSEERVRAKGDLSRKRTIIQQDGAAAGDDMPSVDQTITLPGRVLRVHNLFSIVESHDGRQFRCALRRLLRTLATEERNLVTCGDHVWFRPAEAGQFAVPAGTATDTPGAALPEGMIERVEGRHGVLTRASRGRKHVLVANVDQVVFVLSLVEPALKPHLIDRYLASAELGGIAPILCLNKVDLVDPSHYQQLVGLYSQLGVPTILTSIVTGQGIDLLKERLVGRQTVFSGQSGVGKSSLLNKIEPGLGLRVREISDVNQKGKHTTTTSELIRLELGGWVVDTPGVRQFELWNVRPEEVEVFFADIRPFVSLCGYADCTHTHEDRCAVKQAVMRRQISASRYHSYLGLFSGEQT